MTRDDEKRAGTPGGDEGTERRGEGREAAGERPPGAVPDPEPEEAPELLGERSDYPIAWEPGAGDEDDR